MNGDEIFLKRAIALAAQGSNAGEGGPFGAVVVLDGGVVGESWNRVIKDHDPTAHAEMGAIRAACAGLGRFHLPDCTLYASSEPCPMCLAAAYWARIGRIVFANPRQAAAKAGFGDAEIYRELARDAAERAIVTEHRPLPGADEPLRQWAANPERVLY